MLASTTDTYADIRQAVAKLCSRFPGDYWRALDRQRTYPTDFVQALTDAGYLSILIPEEFGGSGLPLSAAAAVLEEIQRCGCTGGACHAQMYTMGTLLRHGSQAQKQRYLPSIASGELRLQAFGVTEPTSGTDTASLKTVARREGNKFIVRGQKIWTNRAEQPMSVYRRMVDLASPRSTTSNANFAKRDFTKWRQSPPI
jgi:alkylation response protein AidB-like acyl-CoA dehydrogenase